MQLQWSRFFASPLMMHSKGISSSDRKRLPSINRNSGVMLSPLTALVMARNDALSMLILSITSGETSQTHQAMAFFLINAVMAKRFDSLSFFESIKSKVFESRRQYHRSRNNRPCQTASANFIAASFQSS